MTQSQSAYFLSDAVHATRRHTLAVLVDNEPGVLARIAGMFSGRGYNIESLTVSETEHEKHVSRITIVTTGTEKVIEQIKTQLDRLVPVHRVVDLTVQGEALERELCLIKVRGKGDARVEALRLASAFGARTLDATLNSFVFELTGTTEEVERFIRLMGVVGLVEVSRTGIAAMSRGPDGMLEAALPDGAQGR
jgi:acetolactate synthase-1/3 small subunit